jgi:hypothetical protein
MGGKYLAIFLLPKPLDEHVRIKRYIETISVGDYEKAFIASGVIAYLFTAGIPASEMDFSTMTLNQDSYLIVELGESFAHSQLNLAGTWLWNHRLRR